MNQVDSMLKEVLRFRGISVRTSDSCYSTAPLLNLLTLIPYFTVSMPRIAVKEITLSDGTLIPKGTFISASVWGTHRDDGVYSDPQVFDPFRFSRGTSDSVSGIVEGTRHQLPNTSVYFIPFGHGSHAWCVILPSISSPRFPFVCLHPLGRGGDVGTSCLHKYPQPGTIFRCGRAQGTSRIPSD